MRGFETVVRNVTVGPDTPPVDVVLSVGRVSTTLTVTASAGRATATRLPVANDERARPGELDSAGTAAAAGRQHRSADALKNASGVQAVRWYGAYEQYTIRGFFDPDMFDDFNVMLVDGMRLGGNRSATQTNNIQSIEVLEGTQFLAVRQGRRWRRHQYHSKEAAGPASLRCQPTAAAGSTRTRCRSAPRGLSGTASRLLYRFDTSFEDSDGWRDAGADPAERVAVAHVDHERRTPA